MRRLLAQRPELAAMAVIGLVLVAWLFGPALFQTGQRIVGYPHSEQLMGTWVNRVFAEGLLEKQRLPLQVDEMVFEKGVLTPLSLNTLLLSLPFHHFSGAAGLFNAAMVINFLLAFAGAFLFFRHLAGDRWSALPGALLYALSPYCLDHFAYGPIECTALGWIPLALLCLEKYPGDRLRHALLSAAMLVLVFTASPYYGLFTAIAAGYLLLTRGDGRRPAQRLRRAALTMGLAAVLVAPFAWGLIVTLKHSQSLTPTRSTPRDPVWHQEYLTRHSVVDLASVILPTRAFQTQLLDKGAYLGIPAIMLCALGVARVRRARRWLWLGLGFLVFALGASLRVGGYLVELGGSPLPLPGRWLLQHVPPFTGLYYPFRAFPLVILAAGAIITLLFARGGLGRPRVHLVLISLALAVEMLFGFREQASLPTASYRVPQFYHQLGKDPGRYGVIDLPAPQSDEDLGRYLLYKLVHRKRVPYDLDRSAFVRSSGEPVVEEQNLALRLAVPNKPRRLDEELGWFRCGLDCDWISRLHVTSYRYLVLHRTGHEELDRRLTACLERCVKEPLHVDADVRVYRAPGPET